MTVKNFKVGQGLDLDGLVLTNGNGELLVNGNAIAVDLTGYATETYVANALTPYATQAYVANAIANSTVDLAPAAGNYIDWNANTEAFDLDFYTVANALAGDGLVYQNGQLAAKTGATIDLGSTFIPVAKDGSGNLAIFDNAITGRLAGNGLSSVKVNGLYHFDIDYGTVATNLVNNYNIAQSNALPTYTTANVLAGYGLNLGYNNYYGSYGIDVDTSVIATTSYVANAISNLVDSAPATLDTLNELAAALQDNPNVITSLQSIASGKQNALTEGFAIDIYGNTIAVDSAAIANAIAGGGLTFQPADNKLHTDTAYIANAIAGSGITYSNGQLTAAPGYISNVTPTFVVTNGQLDLSDTISITSVELTDANAFVTAASDVFGNGSAGGAYLMGNTLAVGSIGLTAEVADVFITLKVDDGITVSSRTSKLTAVFTGGEAPTWTEYGIIASGWTFPTTISFNSNREILVEVVGGGTYSAKGVFTLLK